MTDRTHLQAARGARRRGAGLRTAALLLATTALVACEALPPLQVATGPSVPVRKDFAAYHITHPRMVDDGWVRTFHSPVLTRLVHEAIANNQDLQVAAQRVAEARAIARQSGATVYPTVQAGFEAGQRGVLDGPSNDFYSPSLEVSWEPDLWGRLGNGRAAAALDAEAETALFESVRQSLAAAVAQAWIRAAGDAYLLQLAQNEVDTRSRLARNVEERISAQALLAVDGNLSRANVATARARVATAEGNFKRSVRALEVLLGRYPAAELTHLGGLPGMPAPVPVGLPAQLLERRPDLVAREREVAAAFNRAREAQVARLPRVELSADLVGNSGSIGDALDPGNIVWSLVGNLIAPLIDGGRREEEVQIRTARQQAALASYGAAALRAFQEVENALSDEQTLARREAQLSRAVEELQRAISLEQERFTAGEIDLNRVDDARLQFYQLQQALAEVRIARLQNRVALHLALGGSFEARPVVAAPAATPVAVVVK